MGRPQKVPTSDGRWQCSKCRFFKPPEDFYKNLRMSNGLTARCKDCVDAAQRHPRAESAYDMYRVYLRETYPQITADQLQTALALKRQWLATDDKMERLDLQMAMTNMEATLRTVPPPQTKRTKRTKLLSREGLDPDSDEYKALWAERMKEIGRQIDAQKAAETAQVEADSRTRDESEEEPSLFYKPERWGPPTE
jgi:hypothetical protein